MKQARNLRILIVDDNAAIHGDYKKILTGRQSTSELDDLEAELFGSGSGDGQTDAASPDPDGSPDDFDLDSAFQGEDALKMVCASIEEDRRYAMAFVDMRMPPGWDGLRTIREIWTKDSEILIVICTAYSDYSWDEVRNQLGYTDRLLILKKPFETAEVYQLAVALTEKWRLARAANMRQDQLEAMVEDRTAELTKANEELVSMQKALAAAVNRLQNLATTDGLTGLKNHRAFQDLWAMEWERSRRYNTELSVILMDVDMFKAYNDTFGHPAGDEVLKKIATLLTDVARKGDFVARYGGEEFIVVLPNTDAANAETAAERFRSAVEGSEWPLRPVTASFGVSTMRRSTESAPDLVHEADQALYESKRRGRNCVTHAAASMRPEPVLQA